MSNITKKCHYIPQFYLNNFSIPDKQERIYAYQRNKYPIEVKARNIAAKNDLYIFKNKFTGKKSDEIERMFSCLEGLTAPLITQLISTRNLNCTNLEFSILAEFIAYLYVRNLSFRRKQRNLEIEMMKQSLKLTAQNKDFFTKHLRKVGVKMSNPEEIEKLREQALNFDKHFKIEIKGGESHYLKQSLLLGLELAPIIFYKHWHLLETTGSRIFVTSDNPVTLIRPRSLPPLYGTGFINASIVIPLSPYLCMLLKNSSDRSKVMKANREVVDFVNWHTMFFAHKFVFANIKSKDIKQTFSQTKEGEGDKVVIS